MRYYFGFLHKLYCLLCVISLYSFPVNADSTGTLLQVNSLQTLSIPTLTDGMPASGQRVKVTTPEYKNTDVFHTVYLPESWQKTGERLPIIFEYTGNYFPQSGSTGEPEDAGLGFGLSGGRYIWISLPYISADGTDNEVTWWGDETATISYAKLNVARSIREFNADPDNVFLCGFSRGAIAVNYLGLHDDEIAGLWTAFISHDHYDGVRAWANTQWGMPLQTYRAQALERLQRIGDRPYLVSEKRANGVTESSKTEAYIRSALKETDNFTFNYVDTNEALGGLPNKFAIHVHTDRWLLKPSQYRKATWEWMNDVVLKRQNENREKGMK